MNLSLPPSAAWQPLAGKDWNEEAAGHLLRRAGWTARPAEVERAVSAGLEATLNRLFPEAPPRLAKPRLVERIEDSLPETMRQMAGSAEEERRQVRRELQEKARMAVQELGIKWLDFAAQPENAAAAKWVLFLSDVYVVSAEKVRNAAFIHEHFDILTRQGFSPAPDLTKAVSRSPAMVQYLDLNQNRRGAPNENFARELFELFVLGEGNYTEADIKEAARAFTGYRAVPFGGGFRQLRAQHDSGVKTVFGETGHFSGDDIIDLAYRKPAAATFLPREMARFYLTADGLPAAHLAALGETWRADGFDLRALVRRFFYSRLFFAPEFRGAMIKSPVQLYLGLVQDLQLDVVPLPRYTLLPLRQMGQSLFMPPNVRGWVGGRQWINSATLAARRRLVETLFTPIDERFLNADEQFELVAARSNGIENFTVPDDLLRPLAALDPAASARRLATMFLSGPAAVATLEGLQRFLSADAGVDRQRLRRLRLAAGTLLQSPEYQLC